jgi:MFS superfamily sulfate permease-like transporter/CRP-like cAMP-binding protein
MSSPVIRRASTIRGDVVGGVTAAILSISVSIGYGVLAFHALGDQYVSHGIRAGLLGAALVPLAALALGHRGIAIYAPRSMMALLLSTVVLQSIVPASAKGGGWSVGQTLTVLFLLILLSGVFQALFGALGVGTLIKYIPAPVMAGFQNAVALLILVAQIGTLTGVPAGLSPAHLGAYLGAVQPLGLAVGVGTALVIWRMRRGSARVPPVIAGLVAGTGAYYALDVLGYRGGLGGVVGPLPQAIPTPIYLAGFLSLPDQPELWPVLPTLVGAAVSLAVVSSLDLLLCAKTLDGVTGRKAAGTQELLRLGLANAVAAPFGSLLSGINLGSSTANHRAGGRSALSALVAALAVLAAAHFAGPLIARVPRVVIAGTLVMVAFDLADRWSIRLFRDLLQGRTADWRMPAIDLVVVALVAAVTIALNLMAAVAVGVVLAVASFLLRMSRSVVRRSYRGDVVRSHRTRAPGLMEALTREGRRIVVFELDGPLFFGTAEDLANRVESILREDVLVVILDLRRVNDVDSTAGRIVAQMADRVRRERKHLLLSHPEAHPRVARALRGFGVHAAVGRAAVFPDTDAALEHAEDLLIGALRVQASEGEELPVHRLPAFVGLTAEECAVVEGLLLRRRYEAGEAVIKEGNRDRSLFLIAKGTASVRIDLGDMNRSKRLATFSPGTVFGEVALLDKQPRSATVTADGELVCYELSEEGFDTLTKTHPRIAIYLLMNIGAELSRRLRRSTATVSQLES